MSNGVCLRCRIDSLLYDCDEVHGDVWNVEGRELEQPGSSLELLHCQDSEDVNVEGQKLDQRDPAPQGLHV
jgi:hypothetical protein